MKKLSEQRKRADPKKGQDEEWEDVDEHEREVFATTGYFEMPENIDISEQDQQILK